VRCLVSDIAVALSFSRSLLLRSFFALGGKEASIRCVQTQPKAGRRNGTYFLCYHDVFTCGGRKWRKNDAESAFSAARKLCPALFGDEQNEELLKRLDCLGVIGYDRACASDLYIRSDVAIFVLFRGELGSRSLGLIIVNRFFLSRWADDLDESAAAAAGVGEQEHADRRISTRMSLEAAALPDVNLIASECPKKLLRGVGWDEASSSDEEDDEDVGPFKSHGIGQNILQIECVSINQIQKRAQQNGAVVVSTRSDTHRMEWRFEFAAAAKAHGPVFIRKDGLHAFWIKYSVRDRSLIEGFFALGFTLSEVDLPPSIRNSELSSFLIQPGNSRFFHPAALSPTKSVPSRSIWDDSQIAKLSSLAQCACGKPFECRIEHEQLCSIVLLNPTCDDAECLAHKLLSSERIVAATEKGRRFGKMRANAEFCDRL
jgi:hypothetical protein